MWTAALRAAVAAGVPAVVEALLGGSYRSVKEHSLLQERNNVKQDVQTAVLKGWRKNEGDEEWCLTETFPEEVEREAS